MFSASEARFGWGGEVGKWGGLPYTRYTQDLGKFPTPNFPTFPHQGGHLMFGGSGWKWPGVDVGTGVEVGAVGVGMGGGKVAGCVWIFYVRRVGE